MKDKKSPSITFLLPGSGRGAVGGFKVVYEYANRLVEAGYDVTVVYPLTLRFDSKSLSDKFRMLIYASKSFLRGYSCKGWFALNPKVKERWVWSLNQRHVPKSDIYVATAVETAYYLKDYKRRRDQSIYLIQNFEAWGMSNAEVIASYGFGFHNIAISDWLSEIIIGSGNSSTVIKNGFDFNYFKYLTDVNEREDHSIALMYNPHPSKGCKDGFKAIALLKQKYPDMTVKVFSTNWKPDWMEPWIEYHRLPSKDLHNHIYNSSAVYLAPSHYEGWGLPVGEAMMCGAAVVCTDTAGFHEMVDPGKNGLMVPVGDVDQMVERVSELFDNPSRRKELALAGHSSIQSFTWEESVKKFMNIVTEICPPVSDKE